MPGEWQNSTMQSLLPTTSTVIVNTFDTLFPVSGTSSGSLLGRRLQQAPTTGSAPEPCSQEWVAAFVSSLAENVGLPASAIRVTCALDARKRALLQQQPGGGASGAAAGGSCSDPDWTLDVNMAVPPNSNATRRAAAEGVPLRAYISNAVNDLKDKSDQFAVCETNPEQVAVTTRVTVVYPAGQVAVSEAGPATPDAAIQTSEVQAVCASGASLVSSIITQAGGTVESSTCEVKTEADEPAPTVVKEKKGGSNIIPIAAGAAGGGVAIIALLAGFVVYRKRRGRPSSVKDELDSDAIVAEEESGDVVYMRDNPLGGMGSATLGSPEVGLPSMTGTPARSGASTMLPGRIASVVTTPGGGTALVPPASATSTPTAPTGSGPSIISPASIVGPLPNLPVHPAVQRLRAAPPKRASETGAEGTDPQQPTARSMPGSRRNSESGAPDVPLRQVRSGRIDMNADFPLPPRVSYAGSLGVPTAPNSETGSVEDRPRSSRHRVVPLMFESEGSMGAGMPATLAPRRMGTSNSGRFEPGSARTSETGAAAGGVPGRAVANMLFREARQAFSASGAADSHAHPVSSAPGSPLLSHSRRMSARMTPQHGGSTAPSDEERNTTGSRFRLGSASGNASGNASPRRT